MLSDEQERYYLVSADSKAGYDYLELFYYTFAWIVPFLIWVITPMPQV